MHNTFVRARQVAAFVALSVAVACANGTGVGPALDGAWMHQGVPGSAESITLTSAGSQLSGSGHWTGEACCAGTMAAIGSRHGADVTLDITYTPDAEYSVPVHGSRFVGRLEGDRLTGTMTVGGTSAPYVYERVSGR
jgi:hypothetical protein